MDVNIDEANTHILFDEEDNPVIEFHSKDNIEFYFSIIIEKDKIWITQKDGHKYGSSRADSISEFKDLITETFNKHLNS